MLIDILNPANNITINVKTVQTLGLNGAVYSSQLVYVYQKALQKNKVTEDGFFKLDRNYIFERTQLSIEDQYTIDLNWNKIGLIEKHKDNPDMIKLDVNMLVSIITSEDIKTLTDISKKVKTKSPKGIKETKRQGYINALKNGIVCSNYELLTALRNWVDTIMSNPQNYLSKSSIILFQKTLDTFSGGNLDLALRIVNIAIAQSYKDCQWAINSYERSEKMKNKGISDSTRLPRVTEQKRATKENVSEDTF